MWIVHLALRRPYTFLVLALTILMMGIFAILRTPTDIFPNIRIPVVATIWNYAGLPPEDMANRIILNPERTAQTTVNDVEHTESQSLNGISVVKYFFQPNANEDLAYAQIGAVSQTQLRMMPVGTTPPFVLAFNASTVPILQIAISSQSLPESKVFDLTNTVLRTGLATVQGASVPWPFGGQMRQVQVDLDPNALHAHGLSAADVTTAIGAQNLILPTGTQKIGDLEYFIGLNANPKTVDELNQLPISARGGSVTTVQDVAHVRDGFPPQMNIVRRDGKRAVLMSVLKTGNASTLDIIRGIKDRLPGVRETMPKEIDINLLGDQSVFVRSAISGVIREAIIAAALTALMILLFLGNWRSTLIIAVSIPLSILTSIACLAAVGETINIMTLGGLALAVGILVDDATVTIENIDTHLEHGADVETAILRGAEQIAVPALVSTLAICIVFVPMFLLPGIAKFLFVPLAEAVVFAMLASYVLSRTLVPTLAKYWLKAHVAGHDQVARGIWSRFEAGFQRRFETVREGYRGLLEAALHARWAFVGPFLIATAATALIAFPIGPLPGLGQDFFPAVDGGQIKLHVRARTGSRIDTTTRLCDAIEARIREWIPPGEIESVVDNIGLPNSGINLAYSTSAPIGPADADIYIMLKSGHAPTPRYVKMLRQRLREEFPSAEFAFLSADIVGQILNFGLPAPVDVQISGFNVDGNRQYANRIYDQLKTIPGIVDLRIQQAFDYPTLTVDVDRSKAATLGLTERDVASSLLVSLSGSAQTSPSFWIDPKSGTMYPVTAQTPQYRLSSIADLKATPVTANSAALGSSIPQQLGNLAQFRRGASPAVVSHYNAKPAIDIFASIEGIDLGYVAARINAVVGTVKAEAPRGTTTIVKGQIETMRSSFNGLLLGLAGAVVLIYLLMVVNFQSWTDPFIIITGLPAALAGIVWMLFITHTSVSVPALTGAIMCMGVATANSVLVVSFARDRMRAGDRAIEAAWAAGFTRFRPVIMTALAMVIGMIPMALGFGEGGEQNAPLGRAVIGGLLFATVATLFFVPTVFAMIHGHRETPAPSGDAHV
jgi:CzcA family heavy metal efflux pump